MGVPYADQLAGKQSSVRDALAPVAAGLQWADPFASAESGYRNKAKWVVGGDAHRPTIGILDEHRDGIDLRRCGICDPGLTAAFPVLADAISELGLEPYRVADRAGELKYLIVTISPVGELMVRFVLRTPQHIPAIRRQLPALHRALPGLTVVSVNLHPDHKAVLEGDQEILLTDQATLNMPINDVTLHLRPLSFFQTNTTVAAGLYRQAAAWAAELLPATVLDLYCGAGGFALHCGVGSARVRGIEVSVDAIAGARTSALALPSPDRFDFQVADADVLPATDAELVIVNPPRRGIGAPLAAALEGGSARQVIYSSCNVRTLASDLAAMPSLRPRRARLFDMFPQTRHVEVAVLLERR